MKKNKFINLMILVFLTTIPFLGCKKNDRYISPKESEINDYRFLNSRLKDFAREFVPVLSNKPARDFVVSKIKQKFDDEYEVLINDLFKYQEIYSLVSPSVNQSLHDDLFKRSKQRLFPQIYIPRLQYLDDIGSNEQRTEVNEDTIYVFYSGNAEVDSAQGSEVYPGYRLVNGEFEYYLMVDENYANEHEVWVLSLNESVNAQGRIPTPCEIDPCGPNCPPLNPNENPCVGGGGGGGIDPNDDPDYDPSDNAPETEPFPELGHSKINFKIEYMRVRVHNESWLAGASEISIRAKLVCHNGRREGVPGAEQMEYFSDQKANKLGRLIRKFKRKEIKNVMLVKVDYPLQSNWQSEIPSTDPVHFIYTIFERDIFPAKEHRDYRYSLNSPITGESSPGEFGLFYRSADKNGQGGPYARYYFTNTLFLAQSNTYAGNGLVENSMIAFNTVLF